MSEDEHSGHDQDLVTYDNETGAVYVWVPGMRYKTVHQTIEQIKDFINVDWTRDGQLIGVEILTGRTNEVMQFKTDLEDVVTQYEAAKEINAWFYKRGIEKVLPPQMIYNYVKDGRIDTVDITRGTRTYKMISPSALTRWMNEKYLPNLQKRTARGGRT